VTTYQIWMALRLIQKAMWQKCNPTGTEHKGVKVTLKNGPQSGVEVHGVTGVLANQLNTHGQEMREILMDECETAFPYPRIVVEVATVPTPVGPPPDQQPPGPPIFSPPHPPIVPPSDNDTIQTA